MTVLSSPQSIEEVHGTAVGTETPRGMAKLVSRLDSLLPGIRLSDVLSAAVSHQDLVDILCANGQSLAVVT